MKKLFISTTSIAILASASIALAQGYGAMPAKTPATDMMKGSATSSMKGMDTGMNTGMDTGMNASETGARARTEKGMMGDMGKGEMHRSTVAQFVQTLLGAADRMGGIGDGVRTIAQEQASSSEKISAAVGMVEKRGKFKTFLIGSDYKNLGMIRSEMMSMGNRMGRLSREMERMTSSDDKTAVLAEIQSLKNEQAEIETFIKTNESKFSIFGWAVRLFQK